MPYVTEEHDATYTSVSGLGADPLETQTVPKGTYRALPVGSFVLSQNGLRLATTQPMMVHLLAGTLVEKTSGKLIQSALARLAYDSAAKAEDGRVYPLAIGTTVGLPPGTKMTGAAEGPLVQPGTQPRATVGDPVGDFQKLVGAPIDSKYGPTTHSKGYTWAKNNVSDKAAGFKQNGPIVLKEALPGIDVEALQTAYKTWKARQVSSPAPAVVTPEMSAAAVEDAMAAAGITSSPFVAWFENYWWAVAAVAVLGVGGVLIWQKMKKHPALPAAATAGW